MEARSIMIANCGKLPPNVVLLPQAEIDDGWLELCAIDTKSGVLGWLDLTRQILSQGFGLKDWWPYPRAKIQVQRTQDVHLQLHQAASVQVDGDIVGEAHELQAWVQPGALVVRTS